MNTYIFNLYSKIEASKIDDSKTSLQSQKNCVLIKFINSKFKIFWKNLIIIKL